MGRTKRPRAALSLQTLQAGSFVFTTQHTDHMLAMQDRGLLHYGCAVQPEAFGRLKAPFPGSAALANKRPAPPGPVAQAAVKAKFTETTLLPSAHPEPPLNAAPELTARLVVATEEDVARQLRASIAAQRPIVLPDPPPAMPAQAYTPQYQPAAPQPRPAPPAAQVPQRMQLPSSINHLVQRALVPPLVIQRPAAPPPVARKPRPGWVRILDDIRQIPVKEGAKIRSRIQAAIDLADKEEEVEVCFALEATLVPKVYRANNATETKNLALKVIEDYHD